MIGFGSDTPTEDRFVEQQTKTYFVFLLQEKPAAQAAGADPFR